MTKTKKSRKREFVVYSMDRFALNITNRAHLAPRDLYPWVFTICAHSARQAHYLANEHTWATGPGQLGIRRIALDRWFWDEEINTLAEARAAGLVQDAPYLSNQ